MEGDTSPLDDTILHSADRIVADVAHATTGTVRVYDPKEDYYRDYVDSLHSVNAEQKAEVAAEIVDISSLRRAWFYTLLIVFGAILVVAIMVVGQMLTLPRRFPSLFCWHNKVQKNLKSVAACQGAWINSFLSTDAGATEMALVRAFPSLYRTLNLLTIFTFLPEAASDFLQICVAEHGNLISPILWRGSWTGGRDDQPQDHLTGSLLPFPDTFGDLAPNVPWDPSSAPPRWAGGMVAGPWQCWLYYGTLDPKTEQDVKDCKPGQTNPFRVGWKNKTCNLNPFYDWFQGSDPDSFFRTPAVMEYVSLIGDPRFNTLSRLYNLYQKGLVAFAIDELESSSTMSGIDLYNYVFAPKTIVRGAMQHCDGIGTNQAFQTAAGSTGAGIALLPFMGPFWVVGVPAVIAGSTWYGIWSSGKAKDLCNQEKTEFAQPTNPPLATDSCDTLDRGTCLSVSSAQAVVDPFPCSRYYDD